MAFTSIWEDAVSQLRKYDQLTSNIEADVVILGGGITGMTCAHLLSRSGQRVVLLEALSIGKGTTGYSTGNLYQPVSGRLFRVLDGYDAETARKVVESRADAMKLVSDIVAANNIACDLRTVPWWLYAVDDETRGEVEKERDALRKSGIAVSEEKMTPIGIAPSIAIRIEAQMQFNPYEYVVRLAEASASDACRIYENSAVTEIEAHDDHVTVRTAEGAVRARYAIHATHTPKGTHKVHTSTAPYREYAVAATLDGPLPEPGICWSTQVSAKSIRTYEVRGKQHILCMGSVHKVGQEESAEGAYQAIEAYLKKHFPVTQITHRWSAQGYRSSDQLPLIGELGPHKNVFMATGFRTDGLTYGTLAAMILTDRINGKENRWWHLYHTDRGNLLTAAKDFIKENVNVAAQYISDMPGKGDVASLEEIPPGEGRVVTIDGEKCGVYRDPSGALSAVSAVCTHMACIVEWNNAEETWDCPCHGSRFARNGAVLEGPAMKPLEPRAVTTR
jgi:glycine/D-amino acid oxidase-like deaminating enzyme/nitrite reductase/ring-hydroxylating ferredoxin subunit